MAVYILIDGLGYMPVSSHAPIQVETGPSVQTNFLATHIELSHCPY